MERDLRRRLTFDMLRGFVALADTSDGCALEWHGADGRLEARVPVDSACGASSLAVDSLGERAFVSTSDGIHGYDADGTVHAVDGSGTLVAFDDVGEGLVVASDDRVTMYGIDGVERWSMVVDGVVRAVTGMGEGAGVALSVERGANGALLVLDDTDGSLLSDVRTPGAARALDVSGNGEVLAVTLDRAVHYFDLRAR